MIKIKQSIRGYELLSSLLLLLRIWMTEWAQQTPGQTPGYDALHLRPGEPEADHGGPKGWQQAHPVRGVPRLQGVLYGMPGGTTSKNSSIICGQSFLMSTWLVWHGITIFCIFKTYHYWRGIFLKTEFCFFSPSALVEPDLRPQHCLVCVFLAPRVLHWSLVGVCKEWLQGAPLV